MELQPDSVAGAGPEPSAEVRRLDDVAGRPIDRCRGDAWLGPPPRREPARSVTTSTLPCQRSIRLAEEHRAGEVGAVAAEDAAHVDADGARGLQT